MSKQVQQFTQDFHVARANELLDRADARKADALALTDDDPRWQREFTRNVNDYLWLVGCAEALHCEADLGDEEMDA